VSGQEHHSNLLPWREFGCEMVTISDTAAGEVNTDYLERSLAEHRRQNKQRMIVGLFSAASNVSGILNDDLALTALMHKYGGLAFWDYATAAPYVNIDMNPIVDGDEHGLCAKDAIYFSMHKFVGGPQTPGVLIAKKKLFQNPVPHAGGGGTVVFVTSKEHYYVPVCQIEYF
jgi:selenocysteine lyase/cysteine desulfurase